MPELPEVETVRRGLQPAMEGQRFIRVEVRRSDLRWPLPENFARRLKGKTVTGIGRRAKYLLADLSSGDVLVMHLGMSGSFHIFQEKDRQLGRYHHQRDKHIAHDHVVFHMSSGATVTFNDPRRFGSMKLVPRAKLDDEPLLKVLAPSRSAMNSMPPCWRGLPRQKDSLKAALLDQRIVAGLGNIYVCEALFRAQLSPKRMASTIAGRKGAPNERAERLVEAIKAVLNEAIESGGSSLRDHRRTDGELGMFQHNFRVYDREGEPCPPAYPPPQAGKDSKRTCSGTVRRVVQNGRSTFYCPLCQK